MSAAEAEYLLAECYATGRQRQRQRLIMTKPLNFLSPDGTMATKLLNLLQLENLEFQRHRRRKYAEMYPYPEMGLPAPSCQAWDAWFDINRTGIPEVSEYTTDGDPDDYVLGTLAYNPQQFVS